MENITDFEIKEDLRQSSEYAKYIQSIGWQVIKVDNINIFLRNFLGLKIAKIQRTNTSLNWEKIFNRLKQEKVFSLRWEPTSPLRPSPNFHISSWPLIGTKTLRVNLKPSLKNIFASFKKDCRYALRKCSKLKVQCSINKFDVFYDIWRKEAKRKKLWIPSYKEYQNLLSSFGKQAFCLTYGNLAGAVILTHQNTAYYYYSACLPAGKPLQLPYLIVWECIKQAKKMGCTVWDFEGIYDDRWPNPGWLGFSHFKKSFGGQEIAFPGSFQKWLWPW